MAAWLKSIGGNLIRLESINGISFRDGRCQVYTPDCDNAGWMVSGMKPLPEPEVETLRAGFEAWINWQHEGWIPCGEQSKAILQCPIITVADLITIGRAELEDRLMPERPTFPEADHG